MRIISKIKKDKVNSLPIILIVLYILLGPLPFDVTSHITVRILTFIKAIIFIGLIIKLYKLSISSNNKKSIFYYGIITFCISIIVIIVNGADFRDAFFKKQFPIYEDAYLFYNEKGIEIIQQSKAEKSIFYVRYRKLLSKKFLGIRFSNRCHITEFEGRWIRKDLKTGEEKQMKVIDKKIKTCNNNSQPTSKQKNL